ncbi:MAG TPA: hypothetical protein VFD43_10575, partial [Planctomycetota bacterium]|nr:hypothetical protein [Planctomycetota bacterium]
MKDALGDDPAGPTALHKASLPPSQQDPEEAAAAAADSPGALGASVLLLVAVFALDCLRALRQSITREEAQAWARSFADDPHAVFALLARWCADLPFPPELALRLPSLLGALLYLAGALGLCRLAFGRGWLAFLGFGLLALDPLLFDLQSLGRGDGLGLGLMLCGALQLLRLLKGTSTGAAGSFGAARAIAASLLLGLAAASCAHTLPVALALLLTAAAATLAQRRRLPGGAAASGSSGLTLAGLALVGPPLAALLLWLPLRTAGLPASFSGSASLLDGARALGDASLAHQAGAWPLAPGSACFAPGRDALLLALGPVLLAALLWRLVRVLKRWRAATSLAELEAFERFHVLVGGSLLLAAALVVAGHSLLG